MPGNLSNQEGPSVEARVSQLLRWLLRLERPVKRAFVLCVDLALCLAAIYLAFSLRVGALSFSAQPPLHFAAVALPAMVAIFYWTGVYGQIFRYSGSRTIVQLAQAVTVYTVPLIAIFMVYGVAGVPRTIALIQPILLFGFVATSRLFARHVLMQFVLPRNDPALRKRVLIYGAGDAGQQLAQGMRHDPSFSLAGFIDDDIRLDRQKLDGLVIRHSGSIRDVIRDKQVDTILLALPLISRAKRREIIAGLQGLNIHVQTLPGIQEIVDGEVSISDLREIRIEDLLGRDRVAPNEILLGKALAGKTVLVTGAGGSIGSELCRQIVKARPSKLVLVEMSEHALYLISNELEVAKREGRLENIEIVPELLSVTDRDGTHRVFARHKADTIFHAAAYKHVPLVEANVINGLRNNVLGTLNAAQAARETGTSLFILISTDKAVRPTNVMGASKRVCELILQAMAQEDSRTCFSMVRFGNVLGSSGSVVPQFRKQIEAGGPITLTHRDITRYFMTIPEAAQLVIQAGALAKGGEVYLLDMGEPVRIYDLACTMVTLSGLRVKDQDNPDGDIAIAEVGLRPGEKLYEELIIDADSELTSHPKIWRANEQSLDIETLKSKLDAMFAALAVGESEEALAVLRDLVPEYSSPADGIPSSKQA